MIQLKLDNTNLLTINDINKLPSKVVIKHIASGNRIIEPVTYEVIGGKYKINYKLGNLVEGEYVFTLLTECDEVIYNSLAITNLTKVKIKEFIGEDTEITFINNN